MPSPLSPPKSVRRMNRARNSDGTEPIDTPSLPGSPPKSCGSKMRRPHSVLAHGSFSGLDEDWYTTPTPELNSPPKSVRCLRYAIASDDEEDSLPASSMVHRSPEKAATPVVPASPAPRATPSRCLRLTPARLARAAKLPRSPAVANLITSDVVAQAMPFSHSPGPQAQGRHPILSGGGENLNPQTPSPQHLVTRGAQKARNGDSSPAGRLVKDVPVLSLSSFPKTFQSGSGAEQLRMLHGALHQASRPQSITELIDVLPKDKFDTKRLELLLDVMRSRKLANCTSGLWTVAS
ncbi:hypothetical protein AB1Y20_013383 [Prymnesium parvum]|uniref:Uncharacterized protein n=1 Tax=Prymnesium parvum TaxID=97485 RepID=A0AB34IFG5_PRYPA